MSINPSLICFTPCRLIAWVYSDGLFHSPTSTFCSICQCLQAVLPETMLIPLAWVYGMFHTRVYRLFHSLESTACLTHTNRYSSCHGWVCNICVAQHSKYEDLLCKLYDWSAVRVMWYFPKPNGGPSSIWQMSPSWTIDRMQNLCGLWCQSSLLPVPCKTSFITRWEASFLDRFANHSICS